MRAQALAFALSPDQRARCCESCLAQSDVLKRCAACKGPRYCNEQCQRRDWAAHKILCQGFKKREGSAEKAPTMLLLLLKIARALASDPAAPRIDWLASNQGM